MYTKWPTKLVRRISKIDIEAAEWLRDNWNDLKKYVGLKGYKKTSDRLDSMFVWYRSPQGHAYWESISKKLGE